MRWLGNGRHPYAAGLFATAIVTGCLWQSAGAAEADRSAVPGVDAGSGGAAAAAPPVRETTKRPKAPKAPRRPTVTATPATRSERMSRSNLHSKQSGWFPRGRAIDLVCYQLGQPVRGYFSAPDSGWDNLWYRTGEGTYVSAIDLRTGTFRPIVPACARRVGDISNGLVMTGAARMSAATPAAKQTGSYPAGTRLILTCYARGPAVKGYFSGSYPGGWDDLWYRVSDGSWVADVDVDTWSVPPVTAACPEPPSPQVRTSGMSVPAAAETMITRARSWIEAAVPYDQRAYFTNRFGSYRQDCSGFVSMALGLPSSYTTVTLPQVLHPIARDELVPGDLMLNTAAGNAGHVAIFMGWTDASHSHYLSWEENGLAGRAVAQVVPYPYWPSWTGAANYLPYARG